MIEASADCSGPDAGRCPVADSACSASRRATACRSTLPPSVYGNPVDHLDVLRNHMGRNFFAELIPKCVDRQCTRCERNCRRQPILGAGAGGDGHRDGAVHPGHPLQRRLDLAEFDPVAADLDPVIGPADEFACPVRPEAGQITGAIPGDAVVVDESLGGQVRPAPIAAGDPAPADPQLADHPVRAVRAAGGDNAASVVRQGFSERYRGPVGRYVGDFADRVVDRGLGGAAQAGEPHLRGALTQLPGHRGSDPVPAGRDHPHRRERAGHVEQHRQPAGQEVQHRDPVGVDEPDPMVWVAAMLLVDDDDRTAGGQGGEDVQHRDVAFQRGQRQASVVGTDPEMPGDELDGVHRGVVGDLDALGLTGRAGGEQHVGQSVGIAGDRRQFSSAAACDRIGNRHCGHRQIGQLGAAHQREIHRAAGDHSLRPLVRLVDADGKVDPAGGVDPQQRRHLFGGLGAEHCDGAPVGRARRHARRRPPRAPAGAVRRRSDRPGALKTAGGVRLLRPRCAKKPSCNMRPLGSRWSSSPLPERRAAAAGNSGPRAVSQAASS